MNTFNSAPARRAGRQGGVAAAAALLPALAAAAPALLVLCLRPAAAAARSDPPAVPPAAPPAAAAAPQANLTVVATDKIRGDGSGVARCDFGPVDPLATARLEPIFTLRNDGPSAVTIERLKASCGCTSALLGPGDGSGGGAAAATALPRTLAPGQRTDVRVWVDLSHLHGSITKFVYVYASGQANPAATLQVNAQVREVVSATPPALDFGRVDAGRPHTLPLTVSLDPRLLPADAPLRLVSSNPDVRVTPVLPAAPARPGEPVRRSFAVTLAPGARDGALFGRLSVAADGAAGGDGSAAGATPRAAALLANVGVFLSGRVVGEVSAAPESVVFGSVAAGKPAVLPVLLSARSPAALDGASAASASPWLSVLVRAPRAGEFPNGPAGGAAAGAADRAAAATAVLEVTLAPTTPAGGISTEVTVVTGRGERLVLPVIAAVRAAAPATAAAVSQ